MLRRALTIPIAVKLSHFFTAIPNLACRLDQAGADGLVFFNRFYQPDLDIEQLHVVPSLALSHPGELLLRIHWTAVVFGHIRADLAITGGAHSAEDVLKSVMAGARAVMMTSALFRNGVSHLASVQAGIVRWMEEHEYESVSQMCGSMSQRNVPDPAVYERTSYMRVLSSYTLQTSRR